MVFNQVSENLADNAGITKKIFTCEEIEGRGTLQGSIELKHVDPAIVHFSSTTDLTRYDKVELIRFKDGKLAQQPPSCYYDPSIIKLNILKYKNRHTDEMEEQMKLFREKLQNLTMSNWDPNLLHLLKNYHNALLNPYNSYAGNYQNQPSSPMFNNPVIQPQTQQPFQSPNNRVSQQAVLDKIPSYDRNMNFFDNITTTATMRPPRMGVNSFGNNNYYHQKRPITNNHHNNNANYLRKPNSCANEANSYSSSTGYFSGNDTKSSSFEESIHERPCEKRMSSFDKINMEKNRIEANRKPVAAKKDNDEEEKEPEWFNVPATLDDFIDLHGFEDDDTNLERKESNGSAENKQQNGNETDNMKNPIHQDFQQNRRNSPNNSFNRFMNGYNNNHNNAMNYNRPMQGYNNQNVNNGNQRFRNPLHFNRPARPPVPPLVNPFFDAWRTGKFLNQPHVSFTELMEQNNFPKNLPSTAMHMNEVENRMKQHQNMNGFNQAIPPTAVPQFFQNLATNWGVRVNEMPQNGMYQQQQMNMGGFQQPSPTQEQLQHFTSEIMRNAILRKNQQYHDENNYQK